jgi:hypothetical protein
MNPSSFLPRRARDGVADALTLCVPDTNFVASRQRLQGFENDFIHYYVPKNLEGYRRNANLFVLFSPPFGNKNST